MLKYYANALRGYIRGTKWVLQELQGGKVGSAIPDLEYYIEKLNCLADEMGKEEVP